MAAKRGGIDRLLIAYGQVFQSFWKAGNGMLGSPIKG